MQRRALVVATAFVLALGCDAAEPTEPVTAVAAGGSARTSPAAGQASSQLAAPVALQAATLLPPAFDRRLAPEPATRVRIPAGMLLVGIVTRPRAEMRLGPGIQYELADKVLEQGTKVLAFARVGVWQKVIVFGTWQRGWVHSATLDRPVPNTVPLLVDMRWLPTVVATRDIDEVQDYAAATHLKVAVPRGAQFRTLRLADAETLVWLPQTNSVMWMSRKDVQ